jgi:putative spermidine/putrescine transport system substrate-binding protein
VLWDVVDLDQVDADRLCAEGLLTPIGAGSLPAGADGAAAAADFIPGALGPCSVASLVWSQVVSFDETRYDRGSEVWRLDLEETTPARLRAVLGAELPAAVGVETLSIPELYALAGAQARLNPPKLPATLADFFDLEGFPGKRGLRETPLGTLEIALMADGVAPADVYPALATPEGVDRAFAKLEAIKAEVVWWAAGQEPNRLLAEGAVAMTTNYNLPALTARREGAPTRTIWDGQILSFNVWAIPRGAPNAAEARDFLAFATDAPRLADLAERVGYGPTRRSAVGLLGVDAALGEPLADNLPTGAANLAVALRSDIAFWDENLAALDARFQEWLAH